VEDWETGNFTKFAWQAYGDAPWTIDPTVKWERNYSARSGVIGNSQVSGLLINYNSMIDDSISFHWKVSSEMLHDKLKFYIDGSMVSSYAGEQGWKYAAFPVLAGPHTFKWEYAKDVQNASGSDAAWVDFIVFPPEYKVAAFAGGDGSTCAGSPFQLQGLAMNYDSLAWSTSGTGTFSDIHIMNPLYTPSQADITAGSVNLTLHAWGQYSTDTTNTMALSIVASPTASAGGNQSLCKGTIASLNGTATNYSSVMWMTSGDGTFSNDAILNPAYTPGAQDILNGSVKLKLMVAATIATCLDASDSLLLTIHGLPQVNLGNDTAICANRTVTLNATTANAVSYLWSPSGKTTPTITVDSLGTGIGTAKIKVVVTDNNGCAGKDSLSVTFKDCTGILELQGVSVAIFPNPNAGVFNLEIRSAKPQILTLLVLNTSGEQVYRAENVTINGLDNRKMDLSQLAQGTYLFEITNGSETLVKKLVIRK
jgi:hypothetical protein